MARKKRGTPEISAGAMADIAFLLLIFFLVTTQIAGDKGLLVQLPPKPDTEEKEEVDINKRNIFEIIINSNDQLLVENQPLEDPDLLTDMVKEFVLNPMKKENLAISKDQAIVSITPQRGTSYELFIKVRDNVERAYTEMYAKKVGLKSEEYLALDKDEVEAMDLIDKAMESVYEPMDPVEAEKKKRGEKFKRPKLIRQDFPQQISITIPKQ